MNKSESKMFTDAVDLAIEAARLEGENKRLQIENERLWNLLMTEKSKHKGVVG